MKASDDMPHEGTIKNVVVDKGFGFISAVNEPDYFFHCSSLIDLDFDDTLRERRVQFDIISTPRGPKAVNVRPVER